MPSIINPSNQSVKSYAENVALGLVSNVEIVTLNSSSAVTGTQPAWALSVTTYPYPTGAVTLKISSTSALDTAGGTGAQTVQVKYISFATRLEVTVNVSLNGQTEVTVTSDCFRVNSLKVLTFGTASAPYGVNVGTIYAGYGAVVAGVNALPLSAIAISQNSAQQCIYTVPAGKRLVVYEYVRNNGAITFPARVRFQVRPDLLGGFNTELTDTILYSTTTGTITPIVLEEKTDLLITCAGLGSTAQLTVIIKGYLENA